MNLHVTISTPLYSDKMVAKQNVKKSDLPKTSLKAKNTKKTRNNADGEKIHKVVYTIPAERVSGPVTHKLKYNSGDKIKRAMRIENRRKCKSVLQTYKRSYDAKAENMANMVAELNAQEFFATVTYILDIVSWVIGAKALNAQYNHIAQIENQTHTLAEEVKAYNYFANGRNVDADNAQFLHDMKYSPEYRAYTQAKAQNMKQLVAELDSYQSLAEHYFDILSWVQENKENEAHQKSIDDVKYQIAAELAAHDYYKAGRIIDEQNAQVLRDKSCGKIGKDSYNIFGMSDDIKEIAMQCLDKTSSNKLILTMVKQFVQSRTGVSDFSAAQNTEHNVPTFDKAYDEDNLTVQSLDKTLSRQKVKSKIHQLLNIRTK